jgi:hypothetical protein
VIDGRPEHVLLDNSGPGALVRWWFTANNNGTLRVYLDGSTRPVLEGKPADLVGGDLIFSEPFSFKASDDSTNPDWRAHNLYFPIPYANGCKVTWEGSPSYYQIGYRSYESGTQVKSFTKDDLASHKRAIWEAANHLTAKTRFIVGRETRQSDPVTLRPGEKMTSTLSEASSGAIQKLTIQFEAENYQQALRSLVLSAEFDGEQTVWIPVGSLCGVGYSDEDNKTYFVEVDAESSTLTYWYEMPYRERVDLTLSNYDDQPITIKKLNYTTRVRAWTTDSLYFHATWFEDRNIETHKRSDLNYVTVQGAGRYVGTSITVFNTCTLPNNQTWWGEGDDKVYVDGETFPSIFGTGTEDYFGYAYCRPQRYFTPWISQPRGEGNKKWGYTNNNRHHMLDDIPFRSSLQFDMEIWHPFRKNMNYAAATFFYAKPGSMVNVAPDPAGASHKVALHRDDVLAVDNR